MAHHSIHVFVVLVSPNSNLVIAEEKFQDGPRAAPLVTFATTRPETVTVEFPSR
jgi:hypothetical protein